MVPPLHQAFLDHALPLFQADPALVGVAAAGSYVSGGMDEHSDLDLVVVTSEEVDRFALAASLGPLLSAFTGEHVGEPRLVICLYGPPLLHVDLKFVGLAELAHGLVDRPSVLWERDKRLSLALAGVAPTFPAPSLQWLEDRVWVWLHYGAGKLARGELYEALDLLSFFRGRVLGPLLLAQKGARPMGLRRIEQHVPEALPALARTVAGPDRLAIADALLASVEFYRELRDAAATPTLVRRSDAEREALAYLASILRA